MYKFTAQEVLNEKTLGKIVDDFKKKYIPRFELLEKYYRVKNEILNRTMEEGKPNNKLAHGFARYITNMATSYFIGKPIKYIIEDEMYKEAFHEVINNNYTQSNNFEIAKEMSKKGIAYELLYLDEKGRIKTQKYKAEDIIPVYSNSIGEFLEAAIRLWEIRDLDGNLKKQYAEVYTQEEVCLFERENELVEFQLKDVEANYFEDIPVIVYWNNEEQCGDYENVISLINAYDKGQSDTGNDMEYFTDAYLVLIGSGGGLATDGTEDEEHAVVDLRKNRILQLDAGADAKWLIKQINDTYAENYKNRIHNDIFFLSQVPALTDENFAGNLSGVAIRFKFAGLEELAIMKENSFRSAQKKKIKLITQMLTMRTNVEYNSDEVEQKYERNFIDNDSEIIANVTELEGIVSRQTQLEMLPMIADSSEEMEQIQKEKLELEELTKVKGEFEEF